MGKYEQDARLLLECADNEKEDGGKHEGKQLVEQAKKHGTSPYTLFRICFISSRSSAK